MIYILYDEYEVKPPDELMIPRIRGPINLKLYAIGKKRNAKKEH